MPSGASISAGVQIVPWYELISGLKLPRFAMQEVSRRHYFPFSPLFIKKVTALLVINLLLTEFYAVSTGYNL